MILHRDYKEQVYHKHKLEHYLHLHNQNYLEYNNLQERGGQEVEDEFTLEDFTEAAVFNDPDQLEQLRVLEAEEQSQFTPIGGLARRGGRVTGLTEQ